MASDQQIVEIVAKRFRDTYRETLKEMMQEIDKGDNPEYLKDVAEGDPDTLRVFEGQTREERASVARDVAISGAVADAILFAIKTFR